MTNTIEIKKIGKTVQIIRDNKYVGMSILRDGTGEFIIGTYEKEIMKYHKDMIKDAMKMAKEVL